MDLETGTIEMKRVSLSIKPLKKKWASGDASHLLRRTLFGATFNQIREAEKEGLEGIVSRLLETPVFDEPLAYLPEETVVERGSSWVKANYPTDETYKSYHENARRDSLTAWLIKRINSRQFSVHEKMCLFWHNHFAATASSDSRASYSYYYKIQKNALGNFKELVKEITIDPCMLLFLNGNDNSAIHPNENYSRELLELFTIGKGLQAGVGDYTNYNEQDVKEGARILTGWTVHGLLSDKELPYAKFDENQHDQETKKLSLRFKNAEIPNHGEGEYASYIELIFKQDETARFICRKLYRWFVNYEITEEIEKKIIKELAITLRKNDFEIRPVLKQLLMSEHFFDPSFRGAIIKNPAEFLFSFLNPAYTNYEGDVNVQYNMYMNCHNMLQLLGMNYVMPPSVSGWAAYYMEPDYYKLWINASYIKSRFDFIGLFTLKNGIEVDKQFFSMNIMEFLNNLSKPEDPEKLIDDMILVFLPNGLDTEKKSILKSTLLDNLPDYEWTKQFNEYSANKNDKNFIEPLKTRVVLTMDKLFRFPEFQTM